MPAGIAIEDSKVRNMSSEGKGTIEAPGKNVRQKSGQASAILGQGWDRFRTRLGERWQAEVAPSWGGSSDEDKPTAPKSESRGEPGGSQEEVKRKSRGSQEEVKRVDDLSPTEQA
jgi:putative transposase